MQTMPTIASHACVVISECRILMPVVVDYCTLYLMHITFIFNKNRKFN